MISIKSCARSSAAAGLSLGACLAGTAPAQATEYGLGNYLLGYSIPLIGYTPPPGLYYSNTFYLYSGKSSANLKFPFGAFVAADLSYQFVVNVSQVTWVTDLKALGGSIGFAALVPFGSDRNTAGADFTGPRGRTVGFDRTDTVNALGDTAYAAFIGWEAGEHHWNFTLTGFAPTASYQDGRLANMGLNRPGVDLKGGYTFLSPQTGFEVSAGLGITINALNAASQYQSGDELHFEWALNQHLPFGLSAGVGGYVYQQVTNDGGQGNEQTGHFRGRVIALGPLLSYTIKAGDQQVTLSGRWFHDFDVKNRVRGDAIFASLAFPL